MKESSASIKKALIVEDEPAISHMCLRILTGMGFEVDTAADGKAAQDLLAEKQYDLCLFDFRLPLLSGRELYQWLMERYPQQAARVIFTTGELPGGDNLLFLNQSARPILPKPFTPGELQAIVSEILKEK